jgi:fatty acid desaturase
MTMALLSFVGAVATHNAMHTPIFKARWANRIFQCVLTVWGGQTVSVYVPGHNLSHHKHLESALDAMRTTKARWRWNLLNGVFFLVSVRSVFLMEFRYAAVMKKKSRAFFRQYVAEYAALVATVGVLAAVDAQKLLLYVVVPWAYSIWGIVTINYLQHDGCDPQSAMNHSRNFVGRWVNWFTLNNGFHGIHHMKPGLHWSLLREEHERVVHPFIHPSLEQRSLLAYIWRTFILPARRMTYDGRPIELPPPTADDSWIPGAPEKGVS